MFILLAHNVRSAIKMCVLKKKYYKKSCHCMQLSIVAREPKIDSGPDAQKWGREIDLPHILAV